MDVDGKEYSVHKGQMFLIKPEQLAYYKADFSDPWLYRWIEFNGSMSKKVLEIFDSAVITDNDSSDIGKALLAVTESTDVTFEILMQLFWAFIATLTQNYTQVVFVAAEEYVKKADLFIKNNIHKKITVSDTAAHIGINRSYLCRLFKEYKKISPQEYIINVKMDTAAQYLSNTGISIAEAANSVGYYDYRVFNKAFHKRFNISPSEWRKRKCWEKSIIKGL